MSKEKSYKKNINSWKACMPGHLGDLFYHVPKSEAATTRLTSFQLTKKGRNALSKTNDISCLRIYMGCSKGKNEREIFSPWFSIVSGKKKKKEEKFYEMDVFEAIRPSVSPAPGRTGVGEATILATAANLFRLKWLELSNEELSNAFSGYTVPDINSIGKANKNHPPTNLRVNYYEFDQTDAKKIISRLKKNKDDELYLHLGAGLQVQIFHPFNFRPIIQVGKIAGMGLTTRQDDDGGSDCYERSQPCPPYCPDGMG